MQAIRLRVPDMRENKCRLNWVRATVLSAKRVDWPEKSQMVTGADTFAAAVIEVDAKAVDRRGGQPARHPRVPPGLRVAAGGAGAGGPAASRTSCQKSRSSQRPNLEPASRTVPQWTKPSCRCSAMLAAFAACCLSYPECPRSWSTLQYIAGLQTGPQRAGRVSPCLLKCHTA